MTVDDYMRLPWTIVVRYHDREGGYWSAEVAELPGCRHATSNRADLLSQLEVVQRIMLDTMLQLGEPIPEPEWQRGGTPAADGPSIWRSAQ